MAEETKRLMNQRTASASNAVREFSFIDIDDNMNISYSVVVSVVTAAFPSCVHSTVV